MPIYPLSFWPTAGYKKRQRDTCSNRLANSPSRSHARSVAPSARGTRIRHSCLLTFNEMDMLQQMSPSTTYHLPPSQPDRLHPAFAPVEPLCMLSPGGSCCANSSVDFCLCCSLDSKMFENAHMEKSMDILKFATPTPPPSPLSQRSHQAGNPGVAVIHLSIIYAVN